MNLKQVVTISALMLISGQPAFAAIMYDQDVTPDVIFGTGNANGGFTTDRANSIELGLRGKLRHNASGSPENTFNSNGDGTYSFDAGVAPTQSSPTAVWSFEWSINSDWDGLGSGRNLDELTYELGIDSDPGLGSSFSVLDPIIQTFADHAIGTNATGNGGGTVATTDAGYATLIGSNNVAQNSWKPHWFIGSLGFDPAVDGQYDFYLSASDSSGQLARTSMSVIVGSGAAIPEPATLALLGLGLGGLGFARRRRKAA